MEFFPTIFDKPVKLIKSRSGTSKLIGAFHEFQFRKTSKKPRRDPGKNQKQEPRLGLSCKRGREKERELSQYLS